MQLLVTHPTQKVKLTFVILLESLAGGFWKLKCSFHPLAEVKGLYIGVQAVLALYAQWVRETRGFQPEGPGTWFFLCGDNTWNILKKCCSLRIPNQEKCDFSTLQPLTCTHQNLVADEHVHPDLWQVLDVQMEMEDVREAQQHSNASARFLRSVPKMMCLSH